MKQLAIAAASLALVAAAMLPNAAQADYDDCGTATSTNSAGTKTSFDIRAKKMNCKGAREIAAAFWRRDAGGGTVGASDQVKRFKCTLKSYYGPFKLAFKCRHTKQRGKALKAFWQPETGRPAQPPI